MEKAIETLLPEIRLIQDEFLRAKTIEVWKEAIKQGGWSPEDLQKIPFTLLIPGTKINLIDHVRAVSAY
jgi:hypothetical protein